MMNGKILYILRCIKGMKQSEVARKLKISQQAYSKLERAEILQDDRLDNILAALKSSREELSEIKRIFKI
ncbi:MAG TPA: helix-turn-helix transcriptional regulator [Chitinophagaceae bacterium]|nr:helix-turn-helix transcriptional regulator [Chitinophagaceae bacterium]